MISADTIVDSLETFRLHVEHSPGHRHLYGEFNEIIASINLYRAGGQRLDSRLAPQIIMTVDLLVHENNVGRRPWTGNWETYFEKCMQNAQTLLTEFAAFGDCAAFCPSGYCNQFMDVFQCMDRLDQSYEDSYPFWSRHFAQIASVAARMFMLVADKDAHIEESLLENPDDGVFTSLLTGYAKSSSSSARILLQRYLQDEEERVRRLAGQLLEKYFI